MSKRLSIKAQNTVIIAIGIGILALGVAVVLIFSPRNIASGPVGETATAAQYNPQKADSGIVLPLVPLDGEWSMKDGALAFVGKVEGDTIKIEMVTADGYSATYWHGTFKNAESPNAVITSDKTEAADEIILSQDAQKAFTVGTDGITFKYSALGFSRNITLKR